MDIKNANIEAELFLKLIIQNQPSLFNRESGVYLPKGKELAEFCSTFIDNYAAYLVTQDRPRS
jgi:hypothetical protein